MINIKKLSLLISLFFLSATVSATTLRNVLSDTVFSNPEIMIKIKQVLADRARTIQARAGYYPKLDVNAGWGINWGNNVNNGFTTNSYTRTDLGFSAKQMIFDGFGTRSEVARNVAISNADSFQTWGTAEDIALKAAEAYINVLRTRELVFAAERNLKTHRAIFATIKERAESGVSRESDDKQAYGRLELAKSNLESARNEARDAVTTYERLIGQTPIDLIEPPNPRNADLPSNLNYAIICALQNHPILKAAHIDIKQAFAQNEASKSLFYPRLDLVVTGQMNHNVSGVRGPNDDYKIMLELNYNLINGGKDMARKIETAYEIEKSIETRNRTYRQIIENMKLSWSALISARSRIPSLLGHLRATQTIVVAYKDQFTLGKRTLLDVLDSENELFNSRIAYINGRYDLIDAKYRILNAEGKLLPYFRVAPPAAALEQCCGPEIVCC